MGFAAEEFRLGFFGLIQQFCVQLLLAAPISTRVGIVRIGKNQPASNVLAHFALVTDLTIAAGTVPINPSTAEIWCDQPTNGNVVSWDFSLH
jgi:hypothetical protein